MSLFVFVGMMPAGTGSSVAAPDTVDYYVIQAMRGAGMRSNSGTMLMASFLSIRVGLNDTLIVTCDQSDEGIDSRQISELIIELFSA